MTSIEKAQLIVRRASVDKANYEKYDKALRSLAALERRKGNDDASDFILNELSEALVIATG